MSHSRESFQTEGQKDRRMEGQKDPNSDTKKFGVLITRKIWVASMIYTVQSDTEFELLFIDILLMVEKVIRGGICHMVFQHPKVKDKYMKKIKNEIIRDPLRMYK